MKVTISVGTKFHAFHLAHQLQKRGHLNKIITGYPRFKLKDEKVDSRKIESISWPLFTRELFKRSPLPYNPLTSYRYAELFDRLARKHIEPVDIFVGWSDNSLHTLRKARRLGAKIIIERGSSHISYQRELLREEYNKLGVDEHPVDTKIEEKELTEYDEADYISVPSQFVVDSFVKKGIPEEKLIKTPYGVDLENFKEVPKKDDTFRIMHIGGTIQKGTHYLLKALSEMSLPNSELLLIGNIEKAVQKYFQEYEGKIDHYQHIPHGDLYKQYSRSNVYVLPSIQDGFGMVQLEAMACGLPVISSTNTGGSEVIRSGKEGYIIPIRDVGAIKEKLVFLYENPRQRKEMGRLAKKRAKNFTWDEYGRKITEKYDAIIENF